MEKEKETTPGQAQTGEGMQSPGEERKVKTPPEELYGALSEERRKRREAEERIKAYETEMAELKKAQQQAFNGEWSDEGKALREELLKEIGSVKSTLEKSTETVEYQQALAAYPAIAKSLDDFDEFRTEYPGVPLMKVARLYASEKGILERTPERDGLEAPSGGAVDPVGGQGKMSVDEVRRLRENDPKKYLELIQTGKLKSEHLKPQ